MTETKTCACGKEFLPRSNNQKHCHRRCRNPENHNSLGWEDIQRNYKYKINYGISIFEYNVMFEEQNGCCAVCKTHQSELKTKLEVDHCHETSKVRGLLCSRCNLALGMFKDDPVIIAAAVEYVS